VQIIAESVKFCFYTEHAPKSNMESELNLSFDENEKINFALRFLKYVTGFMQSQRQKRRYQIFLYSQIYTKPTTKIYRKGEINSIFGKAKRDFTLALF